MQTISWIKVYKAVTPSDLPLLGKFWIWENFSAEHQGACGCSLAESTTFQTNSYFTLSLPAQSSPALAQGNF